MYDRHAGEDTFHDFPRGVHDIFESSFAVFLAVCKICLTSA
jgi:hypothetical protein